MTIGYRTTRTPRRWQELASVMTHALQTNDMTTRDDILVQILDQPGADRSPIAWHVPLASDIVINAWKIPGMLELKNDYTHKQIIETAKAHLSNPVGAVWATATRHHSRSSLYDVVIKLRGVLTHEAAHSKWSHHILEKWWAECDPQLAHVISQLDEVRIESMQAELSYDFRTSMRQSARMLIPDEDALKKIRVATEYGWGVNVEHFAYNCVLTLGRYDRGILLRYETSDIMSLAEDVIGFERVQSMRDIWSRFADIEAFEAGPDTMIPLAQEWKDLFPPEEKPLELDGLLGMIMEIFGATGELAEKWAGNGDDTHAPDEMADAETEMTKVFGDGDSDSDPDKDPEEISHGYSRGGGAKFERKAPRPQERTAATLLARRLERLSLSNRTRVPIKSQVPPGKLSSRAAVQRSAEEAMGLMSVAEPWRRSKRLIEKKPQLRVGIMTDVSGSMSWATNFVARLAWIVNKAVRHINSQSASVVFGTQAEPVLGIKDKLDKVVYRKARDGSEAFNSACAALDGQLRLSSPDGARVLVVVSDGHLVAPGEMPAAAKWVEKLTKSGCAVIWVTNSSTTDFYAGYPVIPPGARAIQIDVDVEAETLVDAIADEITKALVSK